MEYKSIFLVSAIIFFLICLYVFLLFVGHMTPFIVFVKHTVLLSRQLHQHALLCKLDMVNI